MTPHCRKRLGRDAMRTLIIQTAMELFVAGGEPNVTMRGVAAEIGYTPGAIYRYFKDKEELLGVLCIQGHLEFNSYIWGHHHARKTNSGSPSPADPLETLSLATRKYIEFALDNPRVYELLFATRLHDFAPSLIARKKTQEFQVTLKSFETLVEYVGLCMKNGKIHADNPLSAALSLWSKLHGLVMLLLRERFLFFNLDQDDIIQRVLFSNCTVEWEAQCVI